MSIAITDDVLLNAVAVDDLILSVAPKDHVYQSKCYDLRILFDAQYVAKTEFANLGIVGRLLHTVECGDEEAARATGRIKHYILSRDAKDIDRQFRDVSWRQHDSNLLGAITVFEEDLIEFSKHISA